MPLIVSYYSRTGHSAGRVWTHTVRFSQVLRIVANSDCCALQYVRPPVVGTSPNSHRPNFCEISYLGYFYLNCRHKINASHEDVRVLMRPFPLSYELWVKNKVTSVHLANNETSTGRLWDKYSKCPVSVYIRQVKEMRYLDVYVISTRNKAEPEKQVTI
jgi:hypothetical protein